MFATKQEIEEIEENLKNDINKNQDGIPTNCVVGFDGEVIPDGYEEININYVDVYSTEETKTNKIWIDKKPIYRKVVNLGNLPNTETKVINSVFYHVDTVVDLHGIASNSQFSFPVGFVTPAWPGIGEVKIYRGGIDLAVQTDVDLSSYTAFVILEYTKTTD